MQLFARSYNPNRVAAVLALTLLLLGCASSRALRPPSAQRKDATNILHASLDRWVAWRSLSARIHVKAKLRDVRVSAPGHLFYLLGERYEVGFVKPYDRILGNFYVTPERVIYWDPKGAPRTYGVNDTFDLSRALMVSTPNWDLRDLLPFPVSGRTGGFQPDSLRDDGQTSAVLGSSGDVAHRLELNSAMGAVTSEVVTRRGRDPVLKTYGRIRMRDGWPIAARVVCQDLSGQFRITWVLRDILLDAEPFLLEEAKSSPSEIGNAE